MSEVVVDTAVLENGTILPTGSGDLSPAEMETAALPQSFIDGDELGMGDERQGHVDVFISYRIMPDERLAAALKKLLEGAMQPRPTVWAASVGGIIPSNIGYRGQISKAARSARVFVGIITKQSKSREWILFEAGAAWGRDALYAPLIFDVTPDELHSTVGEYQATRARDVEEVRLLVDVIAKRTQRAVLDRFTNRYSPFGKIAAAYPNEVEEDGKPSIERLRACFSNDRYDEAIALSEELFSAAKDDREKARIRVASIILDRRNSARARLAKLDAIADSLKAVSPQFYYFRAKNEPREHVALQNYQACLGLQPIDEHRRGALVSLANGKYRRGETGYAINTLRGLILSTSGEDRTAAALAQSRLRADVSAVTKFSLLVVAIGGVPEDQHFRTICELSVEQNWSALACYLAQRYEKEMGSGWSAHWLGVACHNAGLHNLAYEEFAKAGARGWSVAKVNMASMLHASQGVAAAGLAILAAHDGSFESSLPSHPFSVRAKLEDVVSEERTKLERLFERGRVQFQLWLEAVETALNTPPTTVPSLEMTLATGSHKVVIAENALLATPASAGGVLDESTFQGDELVPGLFTMSISGRGVHLLAQDGTGWLSVVIASAVDDGDPVTVHRTPAPIESPAAGQPDSCI